LFYSDGTKFYEEIENHEEYQSDGSNHIREAQGRKKCIWSTALYTFALIGSFAETEMATILHHQLDKRL